MIGIFFFFNDTATTEIYTLSLHDALPISSVAALPGLAEDRRTTGTSGVARAALAATAATACCRSEEHTSELQSRQYLVCRLLLEKKTASSSQLSREITRTQESEINRVQTV